MKRRYRIKYSKWFDSWGREPFIPQYTDSIWPFGGWEPLIMGGAGFKTLEEAMAYIKAEKKIVAENERLNREMRNIYFKP